MCVCVCGTRRLQHSVLTEDKETRVGPRVSLVYKQRIPGTV